VARQGTYGSSAVSFIHAGQSGGSTGPIGLSGPSGPKGHTGPLSYGLSGGTGNELLGFTLAGSTLEQGFSSGVVLYADGALIGYTGPSFQFITGTAEGSTGIGLYDGVCGDQLQGISVRPITATGFGLNVFETIDGNEIVIDYNVGFVGSIELDEAATKNDIIRSFIPEGVSGPFKLGPAATGDRIKYDPIEETLESAISRYAERFKIIGTSPSNYTLLEDFFTWRVDIDPREADFFIVEATTITTGRRIVFNILPPEDSDKGHAISIFVKRHNNPFNDSYQRFGTNVVFPYNRVPCFSLDDNNIGVEQLYNFFWVDGLWYGNLVSQGPVSIGGVTLDGLSVSDSLIFSCNPNQDDPLFRNFEGSFEDVTGVGACCSASGTCDLRTIDGCTNGYFQGVGSTCDTCIAGGTFGGTGSTCDICNVKGPCCIKNTDFGNIQCQQMTAYECLSLGLEENIETIFGGNDISCVDISCNSAFGDLGACCNGVGDCELKTHYDCVESGGFFHGLGVQCIDENGENRCYGGTGACCRPSGDCDSGISGDSCIGTGGYYAGKGTTCSQVNCTNKATSSCSGIIGSQQIKPGDEFAGGVVVGLYNPYGSKLLGARHAFSPGNTMSLIDGNMRNSEYYYSSYDYNGYGISGGTASNCNPFFRTDLPVAGEPLPDSYLLIISKEPIAISGSTLSDYGNPFTQEEFVWGNSGCAWGPLYDEINGKYNDLPNYESYIGNEGYWYDSKYSKSLNNLNSNTFVSCEKARGTKTDPQLWAATHPKQANNGYWRRNWGLLNTIRLVSADNYSDGKFDVRFDQSLFGPTAGEMTSFRAARLLSDGLTSDGQTGENPAAVSNWYLPSHDEMAFIAANCTSDDDYYNFNLNVKLLEHEGVPVDGWHWTSTGAFNEYAGSTLGSGVSGEGVVLGDGSIISGSEAWAMHFNPNGDVTQFFTYKANRLENKYKVRPVRLIRCDSKYLSGDDSLWRVPKVIRDS